ncbi:transcription termination factor 3, mitochondrial [Acipenser oxyrinchus oxyrinchus]|uniref:Transcription termination factor 3, mitochondrial n=1 Tax=Acipenser oxyrinchus oxyrinchus TaxID=40147 RepID=A0AAD8GDX2_ACIOX|nr:transcription termination factor 3, mitochondrial [Acipenser oxyrinchus oxyrinchus]
MASFGYQFYRQCSLLRVSSLVASLHTLRIQHAVQPLVPVYSLPASSSSHKHSWVIPERCRWKTCRFSSTGSAVQPQDKNNQDGLQNSLLPYEGQNQQKATVLGSAVTDSQLVDLESASPLSPFEEISDEEALQIAAQPQLPPASVTLRDYVDQSETLSKLVLLGVDLSKLEQRPNVGNMLLRLDFETDIKEKLFFLKKVGVEESHLGHFITKNPFILRESMENLQDRVSYLESKKFSSTAVARMVSKAPYLLNFSVERLDNRLGFFQKELGLNVQKTMDLVTRLPRLLTGSLEPVKENLKVCQTELGFKENEVRHIVTRIPKLLTASKKKLTGIFDYLHNTMGIPHNLIVKFPQALNAKLLRIKERHLFLKHLGRAQYDPAEPNYISLDRLVSLPDEVFCTEIALASLNDFEMFQKTL